MNSYLISVHLKSFPCPFNKTVFPVSWKGQEIESEKEIFNFKVLAKESLLAKVRAIEILFGTYYKDLDVEKVGNV